jgi:intraflagellar transport protein 140
VYEKAGFFGKAIDLAMKTNQHNTLQSITKHIGDYTDPALLSKTADFFLENSQFEKAVDIFIAGKQVERALELCVQYNIQVTDEMAERLDIDASSEAGVDLLQKLAEVCYRQGNYHLATKKWTQAGNRLQAMKALLKSGDTEKIIFFANVSRERDLYIIAANYLQTLDWRSDAEVMRHVILFYQKGKAYDLLGWFYQACASVEIDEYQNYEKAAGALRESIKYLERAEPTPDVRSKMAIASRQAELVARFLSYQKLYETKPGDAMEGLRSLLSVENINEHVRKGDIYGLMVEHYVKTQNFRSAQQTMDELRSSIPNVNLAYYVSPEALRSLEKALGISFQAA